MQAKIECPPNHFCLPPVQQDHALYAGIGAGVIIGLFGRSLSKLIRWSVAKMKILAPKQVEAIALDNMLNAVADLISGDVDKAAQSVLKERLTDPAALSYLIKESPEKVEQLIKAVDVITHNPEQMPNVIADLILKGVSIDAIKQFIK